MKKIKNFIKLLIVPTKTFYFFTGLLVASAFYFYTEDSYEVEIFTALKKYTLSNIKPNDQSNLDSIVINATLTTHILEKSRESLFLFLDNKSMKSKYLQPITYDLMTGQGACGSNSYVLGRLLKEFKISTRFAQMIVNGKPGGHIVIEANINNKWVVLDAYFNQVFKDSLGKLATFKMIGDNWDFFKNQLQPNYNINYKYEGVQYSNWNKVPILLPFIKKL